MFENRKIKKLISQYAEGELPRVDSKISSELKQLGEHSIRYTIEAFQQRKLNTEKTETLLEAICDSSSLSTFVPLIGETSSEIRRIAKEMLINHKEWRQGSTPLLMDTLKSQDFYARANATEILSMFKEKSCVPTLTSMFNQAEPEIKQCIVKILGALGGRQAAKLFISALNDESWEVQLIAVKFLGKMKDPESVEPLIERLEEKDPKMKKMALDALGAIGDKRASRPMIAKLKDDDLLIRQKATEYLIDIADSEIVPDIIQLLRDEDVNVRRCAVEVLNNLKDPRTSEVLMNAIRDSDWWVRQIATESLADIKGDKIIQAFIAMGKDSDENMRRCAVEFFNKVHDQSTFDSLVKLLGDNDWWVREKAVTAISKLKEKRAIPFLEKMMDDQEVKWVIPGALAEIGGEEVLAPLKEFLLDETNRVRIETIKALGKLKAKGSVADLQECLKDPDEEVRNEAVDALKKITGKTFKVEKIKPPGQGSEAVVSRTRAPEGTTLTEAILVLDVCDSTDIAARYGNNFALNLMKALSDVVKPIAKKERFSFMKNTGDGFFMTFSKVENSVRFALQVLRDVKKHNAKTDGPAKIKLRFSINLGETRLNETGDRMGVAVNMTFRVEGLKPDGLIPIDEGMSQEDMPLENRIFITESVEKELINSKAVQNKLVGLFELKGITGLHKIYHLTYNK